MKKGGIINAELAAALAGLRHTDTFVISDSGLPAGRGPHVIDLGVVYGVPSFEVVLRAILAEIVVEAGLIAEETVTHNPACVELIGGLVPGLERCSHNELKARVSDAVFVIRTGEDKPFANVILRAGVPYFQEPS